MELYIQTLSGIRRVEGYKLPNGLGVHKSLVDKKTWVIVDYESGLYIKKDIKNLSQCYTYARMKTDVDKINKVRQSQRYKNYRQEMKDWKKKNIDN